MNFDLVEQVEGCTEDMSGLVQKAVTDQPTPGGYCWIRRSQEAAGGDVEEVGRERMPAGVGKEREGQIM